MIELKSFSTHVIPTTRAPLHAFIAIYDRSPMICALFIHKSQEQESNLRCSLTKQACCH